MGAVMPPNHHEKSLQGFRILTWIGIIEQLSRNKASHLIGDLVPWPQFILLNHFSHRPLEGKKVTDVARAMQQQQPGVTKTLKAMVEADLLRIEPDPTDGRVKYHFLTDEGIHRHRTAVQRLGPAIEESFETWSEAEMSDLFATLDRLKRFLDENR